ncbi:MAG: AEC family transporter [Thiolinea sp.]
MDVLNLSLPLFGLVLLGWLAAKWKKIPESGLAWMQFYIIYVALPALFFQILRATPIEQLTNFTYIAGTTGTTLGIFALAFIIGRVLQKNKTTVATMQAVAGSYSNIGYMGPALTLPALGEAAVVPTALILCFDNAMLFTLVPILMAMGMDDNQEGILKVLYKRVLLHPFILATIAGISAAYIQLEIPQALDQILTNLKNSAAPGALFTMGVVIAHQKASLKSMDIGILLLIKMIVHPLLVYFVLQWIGITDPVWIQTAVLMAALPPALNVFVLAQHYGVYVQRSSSIVLLGTLIAAITVTALLYILKSGWI